MKARRDTTWAEEDWASLAQSPNAADAHCAWTEGSRLPFTSRIGWAYPKKHVFLDWLAQSWLTFLQMSVGLVKLNPSPMAASVCPGSSAPSSSGDISAEGRPSIHTKRSPQELHHATTRTKIVSIHQSIDVSYINTYINIEIYLQYGWYIWSTICKVTKRMGSKTSLHRSESGLFSMISSPPEAPGDLAGHGSKQIHPSPTWRSRPGSLPFLIKSQTPPKKIIGGKWKNKETSRHVDLFGQASCKLAPVNSKPKSSTSSVASSQKSWVADWEWPLPWSISRGMSVMLFDLSPPERLLQGVRSAHMLHFQAIKALGRSM